MRNRWSQSTLAGITLIVFGGTLSAGQVQQPITIEDLAGRVNIRMVSLGPGGDQVAYLSVKGLPLENVYDISLNLLTADGKSEPHLLSGYHLAPEDVFEKDTGALQPIAGQFVWSPDGKELAYTTHKGSGIEVRVRTLSSGSERVIVKNSNRIEIALKDKELEVTTTSAFRAQERAREEPEDLSLLVKDGYRFYSPLSNPKIHGKFVVEHWKYAWGSPSAIRTSGADSVSYMGFPQEWNEVPSASGGTLKKTADSFTYLPKGIVSPNGAWAASVESSARDLMNPVFAHRTSQIIVKDLTGKEREPRILVPSSKPRVSLTVLGWSADGQEVFYLSYYPRSSSLSAVDLDGRVREIHKEESAFFVPNASSEISNDGSVIVLVRNNNTLPDQLVKINLKTGILTVLWSPNDTFATRAQPRVRFVPIECCDADFWGRLYLPADHHEGEKYPLVFTHYISGPAFPASVGDEVPIQVMTAHGIAVFAMNSSEANLASSTGDFRLEISRVEKPLRAMEWVYRKLTEEGLVDPGRCGVTGLSYGAEIAMYAYWKSKIFRTVSVATGTWEPMMYVLGGIPYSGFLDSRGFSLPDGDSYLKWKEISAGLNARPDLPPLLVQSPDGEEYSTIETWFRLRRVGAQVEWYEYPGEGHVKRSPANKWWVYQRNLDWFRFWLKGEEDPDSTKAEQYARWRELRKMQAQNDTKAKPANVPAPIQSGYKVIKRYPIPGEGSWDYIALDSAAHRLYVSHESQVQVLDADTGKVAGAINATPGVHGVALALEFHRGFTSNGGDKSVTIFDTDSLATIKKVQLQSGTDFILYEPFSKRVFPMNEKTTVIDAQTGNVAGTVDLGGSPEAAVSDGRGSVYVNLADKNAIAVVDPNALSVMKTYPIQYCTSPHSLSYDATNRLLFVGCQGLLAVLDATSGKVVGGSLICSGVDSSAFDPESKLVLESCAEGVVSIVRQATPDYYELIEAVPTQLWAKTMAFDPLTKNIYLPTAEFERLPETDPQKLPQPRIKAESFSVLVLGKQ